MRLHIIYLLIFISIRTCFAQTTDVLEYKAESLSNLADFYFSANNVDKAIDYELQSLVIKDSLFGNNSIQYASSAINIAKYYYTRGKEKNAELGSIHPSDLVNATNYLTLVMKTIKDTYLCGFFDMDSLSRYHTWQSINGLYDNLFPSYVAKNQNDSTISLLYNTILFSKGITWREKPTQEVNWKNIQKELREGEVAIELISPVTPENDNIVFYALTLKSGYSAPHMIKLFNILQIQDSLNTCTTQKEKDIIIGKLIWKNLRKELVGVKKVYFSPTSFLHNIAIEYLPINDFEYYSDSLEFYRLSSTIELTKSRTKKRYKRATLYGGLEYENDLNYKNKENKHKIDRSGFEPLYNTINEITMIRDILEGSGIKCVSFSGTDGDKASIYKLSGQDFDILHLATHGIWVKTGLPLDEDIPLSNSFLALSKANNYFDKASNNGIVTALEISALDFTNLDLVILSACESALGEFGFDDGILGLQRGFKKAGANTIIMSLDKVDDEATMILMVEFYRNLMSGKTKHQSLEDAQQSLRKVENGKYDNPKYWASFIMLDGIN